MQLENTDLALRKHLQAEISELETALAKRRQMLALLVEDSDQESHNEPQTKPWLLRRYLERFHPDGIPISSVPEALKVMGFISREQVPTTNWLRQIKPPQNFFTVIGGQVRLRSNLSEIDGAHESTTAASLLELQISRSKAEE